MPRVTEGHSPTCVRLARITSELRWLQVSEVVFQNHAAALEGVVARTSEPRANVKREPQW